MASDAEVGKFLSGGEIPRDLRGPIAIAREMWRSCWKGMELDGSADLVVLALDRAGYLRTRPSRRTIEKKGPAYATREDAMRAVLHPEDAHDDRGEGLGRKPCTGMTCVRGDVDVSCK